MNLVEQYKHVRLLQLSQAQQSPMALRESLIDLEREAQEAFACSEAECRIRAKEERDQMAQEAAERYAFHRKYLMNSYSP